MMIKRNKTQNEAPACRRMGRFVLAVLSASKTTVSALALLCLTAKATAASFSFSTGDPDGRMATLSHPSSPGKIQTETADDFVVTQSVVISQATFTGLLPLGAPLGSVSNVEIEIYHVFPGDSDTGLISAQQAHEIVAQAAQSECGTIRKFYRQVNLVSDQARVAMVRDTNLVNPWGMSGSDAGGHLREIDAPWGVALAPDTFGKHANQILVGNFGSGTIMAFDGEGHFKGFLEDSSHKPLVQRVNTTGGKAPAVDGTVVGQVARVPYTADYFFFRKQ